MLKQQRALLFWFVMLEIDIADSFLDETFTYLIDWCEFTHCHNALEAREPRVQHHCG
jgi:hypothetical protein